MKNTHNIYLYEGGICFGSYKTKYTFGPNYELIGHIRYDENKGSFTLDDYILFVCSDEGNYSVYYEGNYCLGKSESGNFLVYLRELKFKQL